MVEADDSQGGFLVPEVFKADLQMIALENSIVRPNGATIIPPVKTDSLKIPYVNDVDHSSTVFGGVQASWTAEAVLKDATKPTFGQMELVPHKLAGITYISHELRDDSAIALVPLIKRMFGSAWGYFEDDAFINGTGVGQPLGILNCNALKVVLRHTANMVTLQDLAEMYACMLPPSHGFAIWVINPGVIPNLIELGTGNAAGASGKNLIWIDSSGGAAKKPPMKILGRPVFISEKMQALGTQGDIGYFDLRYYFIFDRQPITIDFSSHVAFTTDEDCWRFVLRVAGQCWPAATITPRNAAAPVTTQSPFVVLDAATS
jgi:HK97 family phage major capsid protein